MSNAIILNSLGDGQYAIKISFENWRVEAKKTALQTTSSDIDQRLESILEDIANAQQSLNSAWLLLNNAIQNQESFETLENYQKYALEKRQHFDQVIAKQKRLLLLKTSIEKEIIDLDRYAPSEIETTAWCVSYNEDLTGETKVIEIDYAIERDPSTNQIRNDTGFWIPATQEQSSPTPPSYFENLQHPLASSPHATWFNLCMLPAVQRDYPLYRVATITNIDTDADTCSITLDGRYTANQFKNSLIDSTPIFPEVDGGQRQNFSAVPINYPPCDSEVFRVGDRVIFDAQAVEVIGFYSNPRKCKNWAWTGALGILNNRPYSNGILGAGPGELRGPVAVGVGILSASADIFPGDLGTVRQTDYTLSVTGSGTTITQEFNFFGLSLVYTQTITSSTTVYTGYHCIYGMHSVNHYAIGDGDSNTSITTTLSINGNNLGIVHAVSIHGSNHLAGLNEKVENRDFNMMSKSFAIYEDGEIIATRIYESSGHFQYATDDYGNTSGSGSYDYTRTTSGNTKKINDNNISGSETYWPSSSLSVLLSPNHRYEMWPIKHGEFPISETFELYV